MFILCIHVFIMWTFFCSAIAANEKYLYETSKGKPEIVNFSQICLVLLPAKCSYYIYVFYTMVNLAAIANAWQSLGVWKLWILFDDVGWALYWPMAELGLSKNNNLFFSISSSCSMFQHEIFLLPESTPLWLKTQLEIIVGIKLDFISRMAKSFLYSQFVPLPPLPSSPLKLIAQHKSTSFLNKKLNGNSTLNDF